MQGKIAALETAKGTIESNISTLQTNLGKAQSDITGLQTQLNNAKTDLEAKITAAKNAATAAAKEALDAEVEILESKISGLQSRIGELESAKATMKNEIAALQQADIDLQSQIAQIESDINDSINIQITALTKQLTDYMEAHANDYKYGYDDGYMAYVNEYAFVTWKILQGNDYIAGPVTTYTLHKKVNTPYGTEIQPLTLPPELQTVSSKQYTYTFAHWSLSPQTGEHPNPKADLPKKRDATDVIYYAQYERAEREYTVTWIIPDDRLDYTNATKIQVTYKYGDAITSLALTEIHGAGVNYLPNGWAATQGGAKITDFGKCMGGRTFYARYTPKQTV
jgi:chaperonin cofactor prefoldin